MTICPIAIVAGCQKCPAFKICPLKGLLGDKPPAPELAAKSKPQQSRAQSGPQSRPKPKSGAKRGAKTRAAAATGK